MAYQGKQGQAGVPYEHHFAGNINRPVNDFCDFSPLRRRPVYTLYTMSLFFEVASYYDSRYYALVDPRKFLYILIMHLPLPFFFVPEESKGLFTVKNLPNSCLIRKSLHCTFYIIKISTDTSDFLT
jgi:hypothetical protein